MRGILTLAFLGLFIYALGLYQDGLLLWAEPAACLAMLVLSVVWWAGEKA